MPSDELLRFLKLAGPRPPVSDCWAWAAGIYNTTGYGAFVNAKGKTEGAHRASYRLFKGPLVKGDHVLHKCDNRRCVNPSHLRKGTNADNMKDRDVKGRGSAPGDPAHPQTKLTWAIVAEIRLKHIQGYRFSTLGRMYGVDESHIANIVRNKTWKCEEL